MGLRLRLKASVDISGYPQPAQVVLRVVKKYDMLLADNCSNWYITARPPSAGTTTNFMPSARSKGEASRSSSLES